MADAVADPEPVVLLDRGQDVADAHRAVDHVRIARGIAIPGAVLALIGVLLTACVAAARADSRRPLASASRRSCWWCRSALGRTRGWTTRGASGTLRVAVWNVLTDPLHGWGVVAGAIAAVALVALGAAASAFTRPRGGRVARA